MTKRLTPPTLRHIHSLLQLGRTGELTDGQLLERFTAGDGEPAEVAFATLVERHGPMVLGVCKAILGEEDAARDAFQATFLILLRKSRALWVQDSLGPWLHRVAHRAARSARAAAERRRFHEQRAAELKEASAHHADGQDDIARIVHEEIALLPPRYRDPLVLCDLEGRTHEDASRHLRCPIGTVKSRLARGRERLRGRMLRRGLSLSAGVIAAHSATTAHAMIPETLLRGTLEIVKDVAMGYPAAEAASTVVLLAKEVHRSMFPTKFAMTMLFASAMASLAFGVGVLAPPDKGAATPPVAAPIPKRTLTIHVVDEKGKPLSDALIFRNQIYQTSDDERPRIGNEKYRTDAEGKATLDLPGNSIDLRIWASHKGFVPLHAMWSKQFQADGDRIPEEFTFKLKRGTEIGGLVLDEEGKPIAGARVEVIDQSAKRFHHIKPMEPGVRPVRSYSLAEGDDALITDAQGRWVLFNVPTDDDLIFQPDTDPPLELRISHPDYHPSIIGVDGLRRKQGISLKSLRHHSGRMVLEKK